MGRNFSGQVKNKEQISIKKSLLLSIMFWKWMWHSCFLFSSINLYVM